ncbi:MAG TPA: cellulase family glycosylhydrolase [Pyrinomonadaceae bacterium]|nr:cellulase family glycosylhydrolase [Pyrinomonadaceae bacterium]
MKQNFFFLALAFVVGAAIILTVREPAARRKTAPPHFVTTSGTRFVVDGQPFRFVGANVAVMYREEDRERMPETLSEAARLGIGVVRVWAFGEGTERDGVMSVGRDREDWPRTHPFRRAPGDWNEEAFVHLDRVLAEAARRNLRVQLCLTNWWRDTGGVTQYLRWAGVNDAADDAQPFGINVERAMLFYTNEETRKLYRQHVERIVSRRNTVTGALYRDDPTIFSYELMNEAQGLPGRWEERRAWVAEMSAYVKSLDANHLVTPGTWGYRSAFERRAWLEEHRLPNVDFCDIHNYPRDDLDTFVDSPRALGEFITNRAAASFSLNKPYVMGEFGMGAEGYQGTPQAEWFRAYFEHSARNGAGGAIFWILTPDPRRGYGVTYTDARDQAVRAEVTRAAALFAAERDASPPADTLDASRHLIPRQFAFTRAADDKGALPAITNPMPSGGLLYRFLPEQAARGRFEKMDGGDGYVWGAGVGFFEYVVPGREDWRKVGEIVVRAHVQPVLPVEVGDRFKETRVTLYINGTNCGSRLVGVEEAAKKPTNATAGNSPQVLIQEWRVRSLVTRAQAARGRPLSVRFVVELDADRPFGINLSNFPAGYDARDAKPIEVEVR